MKNEMETKMIDFEGGQLLGVKTKDGVFLGVKKTCLDIGFSEGQARRQVENIQKDLVLFPKCRKFAMVQNEGDRQVTREILGLHEDVVTLWLAKITLTPTMKKENPEAVHKLVNYQLKCAKVLHEAFSLEDIKEQLELKGEIVELNNKIDGLTQEVTQLKKTNDLFVDNLTINSHQAQKLNKLARERINTILGGTQSPKYKKESRRYFKQIWLNLADKFEITSYKDLNPIYIGDATTFIQNWSMM